MHNILAEERETELELPASLYVVSEDIDKSFFYGILTEGFLIKPAISEYLIRVINPSPQVLFTYSMDNLSPPEKVKVNQILYGYSQKKKDKRYTYECMIQDIHGERLRSGIIVLQKIFYFLWFENQRFSQPQKYEGELERFMRSRNLNYRKKVIFA